MNQAKESNKQSQQEMILAHLKAYKSITPIEALNAYGCFRLGARIFNLRRSGIGIKTETMAVGGKSFAKYSLIN